MISYRINPVKQLFKTNNKANCMEVNTDEKHFLQIANLIFNFSHNACRCDRMFKGSKQ